MFGNNALFLILLLLIKEENSNININFNVRDQNNKCIDKAYIIIKSLSSNFGINGSTDKSGNAIVRCILKDTYKIYIYKEGYKSKCFTVDLCKVYKFLNCNITLCRTTPNRLYGFITDQYDQVVDKAFVVVYKVIGNNSYVPIRFTYTDFTGEYDFINLPKACYIVKAIK